MGFLRYTSETAASTSRAGGLTLMIGGAALCATGAAGLALVAADQLAFTWHQGALLIIGALVAWVGWSLAPDLSGPKPKA